MGLNSSYHGVILPFNMLLELSCHSRVRGYSGKIYEAVK